MIDLIGKRNYFFALSILLLLAGIVGFIVNGGFKLDIQFQGGTIVEVQMPDGNFDTDKATEVASNAVNKKVTAQRLETLNAQDTGKKMYFMQLNVSSKEALVGDEQTKMLDALRKDFKIQENAEIRVRNVQASLGKEIMADGVKAVVVSSLLIILYIWWRFNVMSGASAGVFAVLALLHDVALMFAVYAIFRVPLNESFIAAALTVIGYSMNDTIIIYDRIRENSNLLRKMPIAELVNRSIIQTLSRSINTVVTVLVCVITVFIYASINNIESVREFSLPLIIGIASGMYSSIFVACPLWVMWKESRAKKRIASKPVKA
jgi:preprotein translocase subunit SecF